MNPTLFPTRSERELISAALDRALYAADEHVVAGSVTPTLDRSRFLEELSTYDFACPRPIEHVARWVIESMECGIVHVAHPRYFGLFNPTPTFPSQCADRIVAAFNPQLATHTTSPVPVDIEAHVIGAIGGLVGLPQASRGHFTAGGSDANCSALLLALCAASPLFSEHGTRAFRSEPVFYVSRDAHLAWIKVACQAGLGRQAVHLVSTDGFGRLDVEALETAIENDREQGRFPFLLAATAGTTNAGMVDPLSACADCAAKHGLWFHVDAAWGGALLTSPQRRSVLAGIERADSVTIDGHKWFATTMGCGMFLTRHPELLSEAFHVSVSYMPSKSPIDPYLTSSQWSRSFVGLRLFLSLAVAGWSGYADHIEHTLSLAQLLAAELSSLGWHVVNASPVGVVCVVPPEPMDLRPLIQRVQQSGRAWASIANFEGRVVIRACITSGLSTAGDVAALVRALTDARDAIRRQGEYDG